MEKKTGIIKSISKKDGGRNAFTLVGVKAEDGKDQWYNGYSLDAEKGDKIEFELEINENWHNFSKVKVIEKATKSGTNATSAEFRVNVDAGNCVQRAVELVNNNDALGVEGLMDTTMKTVAAFKAAKRELEGTVEDKPAETPGAI